MLVVDLLLINVFFFLWLGLGAIAVGLLLLLFPAMSIIIQTILWGIFSLILIGFWLKFRKHLSPLRRPEAMIGITGVIVEWQGDKGRIRFQRPYGGDDVWEATATTQLVKGEHVKVVKVNAAKRSVELSK